MSDGAAVPPKVVVQAGQQPQVLSAPTGVLAVATSGEGVPEKVTVQPGQQPQILQSPSGSAFAKMPPIARAGYNLAMFVLAIVSGAIIILFGYLGLHDATNDRSQNYVYSEVLRQTMVAGIFPDPARLEKWRDSLRTLSIARQAGPPPSDQEKREARDLSDALKRDNVVSEEQNKALSACVDPSVLPASSQPSLLLGQCADILDMLDKEALSAATNLEKDRLLIDLTKQVEEHGQNFHAFFVQIAQIVLLNLLLPLLTALFGYIFGSQQARQAAGGEAN